MQLGVIQYSKNIWDIHRNYWIDVNIVPPDIITHDTGRNFKSKEFQQLTKDMRSTTNEAPIGTHQSFGHIKRYHSPLHSAYEIVSSELSGTSIDKNIKLKITVNAINETVEPDSIISKLFVFDAYPRMNEIDPPAPGIIKRSKTIKAAIEEVHVTTPLCLYRIIYICCEYLYVY